jgi:hypothetical protein
VFTDWCILPVVDVSSHFSHGRDGTTPEGFGSEFSTIRGTLMAQPESLLLFYRPPVTGTGVPNRPGVAVTGRLDAFGNYTDLGTYTGFDHWSHIVAANTTSGLVLFQDFFVRTTTVGQVGSDGSYADVKNLTDVPITPTVVSTRDGILIFYYSASENGIALGIAETGRFAANGDFVRLSEPRRLDLWSHIVPTVDGLVLFSLADQGTAATGRITPEGAFQDLKSYTGFDPWTQIISTSDGILLFYNSATGAAVTGTIDAEGNYVDLRNITLDRGWGQIVPTTNGLVLFYRGPAEAVVGRIDAQGAYVDVALVNGLESWVKIVSVRSA